MQTKSIYSEKIAPIFCIGAAADILGIQPNSAILFYRKIRQVIAYHLEIQADEVFDGSVELDESYFGGQRIRANLRQPHYN